MVSNPDRFEDDFGDDNQRDGKFVIDGGTEAEFLFDPRRVKLRDLASMKWLHRLVPETLPTTYPERFRASVGAFLGIIATGMVSMLWMGSSTELPFLIAPIGASAVLLFGVPASPMAQPWSIVGGNLCAAVIGVTAGHAIASPLLAAAIAVAAAFGAMSLLRCVHPPSGAVALTAVLGGPHILAAGYTFIAVPVAMNSFLLALMAIVYNNATRRSYPHVAHAPAPAHPHPPVNELVITREDVDQTLADYGEAIDIGRDDLEKLFIELLGRAQRRTAEKTTRDPYRKS